MPAVRFNYPLQRFLKVSVEIFLRLTRGVDGCAEKKPGRLNTSRRY